MTKEEVLKGVQGIFIDILDNESIVLTENSTANDIEEWDSLTNIQIIIEVENHFGVKFTSNEMQNWPTVGAMIDSLITKL